MPRRDLLRLLLGALTLAGLLAMHGLAAHGTTEPVAAAHTGHASHGAHPGTAVASGATASTASTGTDTAGHDHAGHDMAGLCLSLLVGFSLLALLRLAPWRGLALRRPWRPARWTPYHRADDPPDLAALCVLRC